MIVHPVDGTYELFRHFYGIRRFKKSIHEEDEEEEKKPLRDETRSEKS